MSLFVLIPLIGGLWLMVLALVVAACGAAARGDAAYLRGVQACGHATGPGRGARRRAGCQAPRRAERCRSALG
jgi:hypothetical protein